MNKFNISEIGISISLPENYSYFTRSYFNEDAPEADILRDTWKTLLKDPTFFLNAYDMNNLDLPEIVLTASNVPGKDLKFSGEDALNYLLSYTAGGAELIGAKLYGNEIVRLDDKVYIRTLLESYNNDQGVDIYVIQYYTVIANKAITIRFQIYDHKPKRENNELIEKIVRSVEVVSPEVIVPSQMYSSSNGYFGEKMCILPFDGWLVECPIGEDKAVFGTHHIIFYSEDKLSRITVSCGDIERALQVQELDLPDVNFSFPIDNIYTVNTLLKIESELCKPDAVIKHSYINGNEFYIFPAKEENETVALTLKNGYSYMISFVDNSSGKYSDFLMDFLNKIRINGSTDGNQ